ncbi:unnamed protein product [Phytomonas sp. Hart1]|nr:unnamed protein product [Phytomonas sp. Hart1]|eukprot:CCW65929.1 unnamed protein product [Phytomonas sp. isolate Hart1]
MINDKLLASQALIDRRRYEALDPFRWTHHPSHYVTTNQLVKSYFSVYLYDLQGIFASPGKVDLTSKSSLCGLGFRETTVNSLIVSLQVLHCEETLTPVIQSCVSTPQRSNESSGLAPPDVQLLQEWVMFPLRLCDLPLDAVVDCRVYDSKGGSCLGVSRFHPFNLVGELRMGRLACELRRPPEVGGEVVFHEFSDNEIPSHDGKEYGSNRRDSSASVSSSIQENVFGESLLHARYRGMFPNIPWLDAITEDFLQHEARLVTSVEKSENKLMSSSDGPSQGHEKTYLRLYLPLPSEPIPILAQHTPEGFLGVKDSNMYYTTTTLLKAYEADANTPYVDHYYLFRNHNICEAMAAIQARSLYLLYDTTATPGIWERRRLMELAARQPIQFDSPRIEDVALLWKYRHFVCKDPRLFLTFLRTVDWSQPHSAEGRVATELIAECKSVGLAEVLSCLSRLFSGVAPVRQFAVKLLSREDNARLCWLSVFLIQALRYESKSKELTSFLLNRASRHWELCCSLYWGCYVEGALESEVGQRPPAEPESPICTFFHQLEDRLRKTHPFFLNRLQCQQRLVDSLRELCSTLQKASTDRPGKIELGRRLLERMACGFDMVFSRLGDTEAQSELPSIPLAMNANKRNERSDDIHDHRLDLSSTATLPCHPAVVFDGVCSSGFSIFKSSKLPVQVVFRLAARSPNSPQFAPETGDDLTASKASFEGGRFSPRERVPGPIKEEEELEENSSVGEKVSTDLRALSDTAEMIQDTDVFRPLAFGASSNAIVELPLMFKLNDDVRQDQLVLQLLYWVDSLLRQDGLDLCLTPYRVVATGPNEGLIEVVLNVVTFQSVQRDVLKYLRQHNSTHLGMQEAMDRYKRSFAGYCVLTFVLGIGDRHLENILVAQDGRLLHIDFGYILGNDPKLFPPPMKISREMIDVLGGPQSVGYVEFKSYCCSAYNILRKHAALFLHMLQLMSNARSLPQITGNEAVDPYLILMQVQDKLRLDLNSAQATQYLQTIIADSVGSVFTGLWDVLHAAAQATRV